MNNAKIGAAIAGGYVLGRTKKAKLALGLAMALAGSRIKPGQLGKSLARSPLLSNVNKQVRGELASAGKAAATTVLNAKAEHLADALHRRTLSLREGADEDEADEDEQGAADEDAGDREDEPREEPERKPAPRRTTSSRQSSAPAAKKSEGAAQRSSPKASATATSKGSHSRSSRRPDDG